MPRRPMRVKRSFKKRSFKRRSFKSRRRGGGRVSGLKIGYRL